VPIAHDGLDAFGTPALPATWWARHRTALLLTVISAVGVGAFGYPFVLALAPGSEHRAEAPWLFAAVTGLCLLAALTIAAEGLAGAGQTKTIALLGVLVAIDATLRLVPGVLGASPIFPLIIVVGVVFGAALGFQMGALTVLLSAFLTGGVGPWLPFQMFVAGWVGLTAGWLPSVRSPRLRLAMIVAFGALWGFLFGAIMNLWMWPFTAPAVDADTGLYWVPGLALDETVKRYISFYVTTSLVFDVTRAIGNAVILALLAMPVLRLLERYRRRFTWEPWDDAGH
jgi:energy-coupling factor transport system substrate-specific component